MSDLTRVDNPYQSPAVVECDKSADAEAELACRIVTWATSLQVLTISLPMGAFLAMWLNHRISFTGAAVNCGLLMVAWSLSVVFAGFTRALIREIAQWRRR